MRKLSLLILIFVLTALACNMPGYAPSPAESQSTYKLITADPNATSTPTPFQPQALIPTANATPIPVAVTSDTPAVTGTFTTPQNILKILVLGSDQRQDAGFRTDVMVFVVVNMDTGAISMTSFPRDLYVDIPGVGPQRLNTAQEFGGFPLTVQTFQNNFGIAPDYYLLTNFQGFTSIVDSLGGIEIDAAQNLTDTCKLPGAVNGYCSFGPGKVTMDAQTALWYVRSRYSSSDFDRTRRQQEVLVGLFRKLMSLNAITKIPTMYQQFSQNVETNIPLDVVVKLASYAPGLITNSEKIHHYAIGTNDVWHYVTAGGAQVLLPNPERIQPILQEAVNVQ